LEEVDHKLEMNMQPIMLKFFLVASTPLGFGVGSFLGEVTFAVLIPSFA
jgi:hypothetical protein